ncbi:MAG: LysM domain-containing protein [Candidatus Moranbacteria bacterium]|nr:LysM domain-containing protein [Candidatus Moranbacteria bacterium]
MKNLKAIRLLIAAVVLAVLAFFGTADAVEFYTVKKGDCLSKIAKKHGVLVKEFHNANKDRIKNINLIYPNQVFVVPNEYAEFSFENPGEEKYQGTLNEALKLHKYPEMAQELLKEEVRKGNYKWVEIKNGDKFAMVFGKNKIRRNTIANLKKPIKAKKYTAKVGDLEYVLLYPPACKNWAMPPGLTPTPTKMEPPREEKTPETPAKVEVPGTTPPKEEIVATPTVVTPTTPEKKEAPPKDEAKPSEDLFEFYVGGGYYHNAHVGNASGDFLWAKLRYFPITFKSENYKYRLGAFMSGFLGEGNDRDYEYRNKRLAGGISGKVEGDSMDATLDLGVGRIWKHGDKDTAGKEFHSRQTDNIFLISGNLKDYERRLRGEKLFPETELNVEAIFPFDRKESRSFNGKSLSSSPWNNQIVTADFTQWIYDIYVSDETRIMPGISLGGGYDWGPEKAFGLVGPAVRLNSYNQNILQVNAGYKEEFGGKGDNFKISAWVSLNGVYNAIQAARISEANGEDMIYRGPEAERQKQARPDVVHVTSLVDMRPSE